MADDNDERRKLIIDALFHEYDALRAEIVARTSSRFQLVGLAAVAATLVTAKWAAGWGILLISVGTIIFAAVIWLAFRLYINRCAARLEQIEDQINKQIRQCSWPNNQPVLMWESKLLKLHWFRHPLEKKSAMLVRWTEKLSEPASQ
jgi:hypothetical protein